LIAVLARLTAVSPSVIVSMFKDYYTIVSINLFEKKEWFIINSLYFSRNEDIMKKIIIILLITIGLFISGCLNESAPKAVSNDVEPQVTSKTVTPTSTQSEDQSIQFEEMKNRLNKLEEKITILEEKVNSVGILTPSKKQLIPQVPFRLEAKYADWQPPIVWKFKENGFVDMGSDLDAATYKLYRNNNTIVIESKAYDYYGLVIYDEYVTAIYKNGWPDWVYKYTLFPPRFNPETQKYELN
jgi:hypothetical protein